MPEKILPFYSEWHMSYILANHIGRTTHIIVPNVSYGLIPYEADLLVLHKSGFVDEIEIKISKADIRRDKAKRHNHESNKIRRLWFAIPARLKDYISDIPERAGIMLVDKRGYVIILRKPKINVMARHLFPIERFQLARLGYLRMWNFVQNDMNNTKFEVEQDDV